MNASKQNQVRRLALVTLLMFALCFALVPAWALAEAEEQGAVDAGIEQTESLNEALTTNVKADSINKYGNVGLDLTYDDLSNAGLEPGDVVTVSFLNKSIDMPLCSLPSDVDAGEPTLLEYARESDVVIALLINRGDFATTYGVATKDESDTWTLADGATEVPLTIELKEKHGYYDEYVMRHLVMSNDRDDYTGKSQGYPSLTDDEFANFRVVDTTGMGKSKLYRSSSPVNPKIGRNTYANTALANANVAAIIDLADSEDELVAYPGYGESVCANVAHTAVSMSADYSADEFDHKFAEGLRFMTKNSAPFAIFCNEGKDRTGIVVAILECLMGASLADVVDDYMITYYNYYGVQKQEERYDVIALNQLLRPLQDTLGVESLEESDLAEATEQYLLRIGLSDDEIAILKASLSDPAPVAYHTVTFDVNGYAEPPATQTVEDGARIQKPADPIAEGYTFGGWFMDKECTDSFDFDSAITQDLTLYAKWTKQSSESSASSSKSSTSSTSSKLPSTGDVGTNPIVFLAMAIALLAGASAIRES